MAAAAAGWPRRFVEEEGRGRRARAATSPSSSAREITQEGEEEEMDLAERKKSISDGSSLELQDTWNTMEELVKQVIKVKASWIALRYSPILAKFVRFVII